MVLDRTGAKATAIGRIEHNAKLTVRNGENVVLELDRKEMQREWYEMSYRIQAMRDNPTTAAEEFNRILDDD